MISSQSFLKIFKSLPLPSLVLLADGPNFTITAATASYLNNIGKSEADVIGKSIAGFDYFNNESNDASLIQSLFIVLNTAQTHKTPVAKYKFICVNGTIQERWLQFENIPVMDASGNIEYIIHNLINHTFPNPEQTNSDITEKNDALQQLKDSEAKLLLIQKIAKIGYWKLELKTKSLYWSDEVYEIWKLDKESFKLNFESFFETIYPDDRVELLKAHTAAITGNEELNVEHRILLQDGSFKWIHEKGKLVKNEKNEPVIFEGSIQDITTEKQLKLSLEESNQRYGYVSQATSDAIWDWNLVTNIIFWGEGFETIFGYNVKGQTHDTSSWKDQIHPDDYERVLAGIDDAIYSTQLNWVNEYRFLKADKTYAYVIDKGFFIRDNYGKAIRMVGAMQDITERKTLEALLDKANRLARIGSWEIDVAKGTVFWSDITKEIREAEPDFAPDLSNGIHYFKEGSNRETISRRVQDCIKHGTPWDEELQIVTQKGNLKWIRTIGEAEILNGRCIKVYGSFQDIDDRKKAERQLQEAYNERNTILESIGDVFFAVDKNWNVTYWNQVAETVLKKDKNKMLGKNLWDKYPFAIDSDFYRKAHKALEENKARHFEINVEGVNTWFEVSIFPSFNGLSIYFKDINERIEAIEKIRLSNERFERVTAATNDAIWDIDLVTNILYLGDGFRTLYGKDFHKELYGIDSWLNHIHIEDRPQIERILIESLENKNLSLIEGDYRYIRSSGNIAYINARASIIRDENGKAIRLVGAFSDKTRYKEYEASLKKLNADLEKINRELIVSNVELERFAYVASHDLQEPLRMITSFLSQIEKKYGELLDEKGKQYIHFAVDGAQRMRQIILDLLEFSRAGRKQNNFEEVDLNEMLQSIISLYRQQQIETNAKIDFGKLPTIITAKSLLSQVFQNLIGNALKYYKKEEAPLIIISSEENETHWQFSIKDNGIGIAKEYFEKIFVIFQRLHHKGEYSGTGIGLAIVKKIVENLGGEIWLQSEENKGSAFFFTIKKYVSQTPENNNFLN